MLFQGRNILIKFWFYANPNIICVMFGEREEKIPIRFS